MFVKFVVLFVIFGTSLRGLRANPPAKCGIYGLPPCLHVPAPPGQTPSCASPGKTYCENLSHYPKRIVHNLLRRYGPNLSKLLVDEIYADFSSNHPIGTFARPAAFGPQFGGHFNPLSSYFPESHAQHQPAAHSPSSNDLTGGYSYPNPASGHPGYDYRAPDSASYSNHYQQSPKSQFVYEVQRVSEYNPADEFRRYARDLSRKYAKALRQPDELELAGDLHEAAASNRTRTKRQTFGRESLCEVTTQLIMPQAALNNQGNWMYVINQPNVPAATQLVKSEACASTVCSKLCQLPIGYGSRCEQKFIQKRLIALNADGQNFYTDTFWFPSCCVCTISNNL